MKRILRGLLELGLVDPAVEKAEFYWLTNDGEQMFGSERQLRAALSSGALSVDCLVWRKGWADWQPAANIAALAASAPPGRDSERKSAPRASRPSASPVQLPPLIARAPLDIARPSTSATRSSFAERAASASHEGQPAVAPREALRNTAPRRGGGLDAHRVSSNAPTGRDSGPPPPPTRARAPSPTPAEEEDGPVSVTATLRPPGAVPPPPHGVPTPPLDASATFAREKSAAALTPIPRFGPPGGQLDTAAAQHRPPARGADPPASSLEGSFPSGARRADEVSRPPPALDRELPSEPVPSSIEPTLVATLEIAQPLVAGVRNRSIELAAADRVVSADPRIGRSAHESVLKVGPLVLQNRSVVLALSALSAALLTALIALALSRRSAAPAPTVASLSASSAAPTLASAPPEGCTLALPAARISANVERSVLPTVANIPGVHALALGFAPSRTEGAGLRLNRETLDVTPAFDEDAKEAVDGVVPLVRSGALSFFVDRDARALRSAHTVDRNPPFTLGLSQAGFTRAAAGTSGLIWPLESNIKITEPRSAQVGGLGYGVTFRRGGQSGEVLLGFLGEDGARKSELVAIPDAPKLLGTPIIAGGAERALVAFAGRDDASAPWQLYASLTAPGSAPAPARAIVAGSGGGAISPALSAFDGRWLVQWTEGSSGQYQVYAQIFSADLSPIASRVRVSPNGANAGQGVVSPFAGGALSLFILTTAGHDELWGTTLSCK